MIFILNKNKNYNMKTKIFSLALLFLSLLVIQNFSYAQTAWVWQNPKPTGENIASVFYVNSSTIYALGTNGSFLISNDNGSSWITKTVMPPSECPEETFYDLSVINPSTIFISSERRVLNSSGFYIIRRVHRTADGGNHWTQSVYDSTTNGNSICFNRQIKFINANTGFDFDYRIYTKSAMKTTDGGASWQKLIIGSADSLVSVYFINENTGWVAGPKGKFYKTTNAGVSWTGNPAISNSNSFFKSYFIDENTGWAYNNYFFKTTNGGASFSQVSSVFSSILSYVFSDGNTGYAIKQNEVMKTTNSGANWTTVSSGIGSALHFLNSTTGVSALAGNIQGNGGKISITTNSGVTWTSNFSTATTYSIEDIQFTDENYGWAVGFNTILKTTNGGDVWSSLPTGSNYNTAVKFINQNTGVVGTYGGVIYTTNAGSSWANVTGGSYSNYNFYRFQAPSVNTIYTLANLNQASDSTVILKSSNSGVSWTLVSSPVQAKEFFFLNDNTGYAITLNSTYKTTNGAASWFQVANIMWKNIHFINENTGWYSADSANVYKTVNGGASWTPGFKDYEGSRTYKMKFFDANTGYRIANSGLEGMRQVQKTTDGGLTFTNMNFVSDSHKLYTFCFLNQNTGWAAGDDGLIVKTTSGGAMGVQQISSVVPDNFLLHQNYPNPFNPTTKINYEIKSSGFVSLKVFDLLGKEVASLINEKQNAGSYSTDFNSTEFNLSSGIYFYTLKTDGFIETKKMILVK